MPDMLEKSYPIDNPAAHNGYYALPDVFMVRGHEDASPVVTVIDVFQHRSWEARSAVREMITKSLDEVDPAVLFGPEASRSKSFKSSTKLDRIKEFELETFSEDIDNPKLDLHALVARDTIRSMMYRSYTATVFDGERPLLHTGFRDAEYDDEWDMYWDGEGQPDEEYTFRRPGIGFMIGDKPRLVGENGVDAITALFAVIEGRQRIHQGSLIDQYSGRQPGSLGPHSEGYFNSYTFGTVPRAEFDTAIELLANQREGGDPA